MKGGNYVCVENLDRYFVRKQNLKKYCMHNMEPYLFKTCSEICDAAL